MNGPSVSWRKLLAIGAMLALTVSACTQTTTTPSPTAAAATATPKPAARGQGGELKILYWQAPTILNQNLSSGTKDFDAARLITEQLGELGPDAKPVAQLAAEVPTVENGGVSKDFTTVTWKLKPGVKWSDGSAFTADDVVFTWQYVADEKTAAFTSDYAEGVKSVVAVDPTTVKITYANPNPNYYQFGANCCGILQKAQFKDFLGEKAKDAPGNLKPIGTGPYKVKEFKPGDVVTYEINENFRDPNKPFFKSVQLKGGGDAASAARAVFQTGDVDYAWNMQVEPAVLRALVQGGKGELLTTYAGTFERLMFNFSDPNKEVNGQRSEKSTKHPFFSDKNVRQAFAMAVDRATIAKELYGDGLTGKVTCNVINGLPAFESKNTASMDVCKFDTAKANKILDDAGWVKGADGIRSKGGVRLKVLYQTTAANPVRAKTQDIIKKGWNAIGAEVELKTVPSAVFFTPKTPDSANYFYADVQMFASGTDPDPTTFLGEWLTRQIAQKENNWGLKNYLRYSNPDYDKLIDVDLRNELDPKKRSELGIKANDILVGDAVVIPIVNRASTNDGRSKDLKGVKPNAWASSLWDVADWSK